MRFLLVDRILAVEGQRRIVAVKTVAHMDDYLTAHYPRRPVAPATLVVEALAQAGGWLHLINHDFGLKTVLALVEGVRLHRPVLPGDTLTLDVQVLRSHSDGATLCGEARVGDEVVATVERLVFAHARSNDEALRQQQRDYFTYISAGRRPAELPAAGPAHPSPSANGPLRPGTDGADA
jgi:3-hydroxyacyl-[acyl-carrier-protein] dehydratase